MHPFGKQVLTCPLPSPSWPDLVRHLPCQDLVPVSLGSTCRTEATYKGLGEHQGGVCVYVSVCECARGQEASAPRAGGAGAAPGSVTGALGRDREGQHRSRKQRSWKCRGERLQRVQGGSEGRG